MIDDEYKELMKFHLLLCDHDLIGMNYAAVDANGSLFVYGYCPCEKQYEINKPMNSPQWTPKEEVDEIQAVTSKFEFIEQLPIPPNWAETLIKL